MAIEKELLKGIELLKQGKEEGFNILYSYTYNYVYGRAKVIMKNEDDALDLTQETFVQAYKGIQQLEDVNNIYAWLGSITYRQGMKMFRKRREVLVGEEAEGIFEDVEDSDSDYHPEASAEEKATADIVKSLIDELPELQKATIMAYYYDNMKIDEIAEAFECSSNTVKSRLNYAKKFLKTKVEEHEKQNRYKLHSLTPAVFIFAFRSLMSGEKYVMSAAVAQGVYDGVCTGAELTSSTIGVGEAGTATMVEPLRSSVASSSSATAIGSTVVTETAVKAGMSIGMKLLLGAAAVLTTGAVVVGGMSLVKDSQNVGGNSTQTEEDSQQNGTEEKKVQKYVIHYETSSASGVGNSVDIRYEFDENDFVIKRKESYSGSDWIDVEMKWETTVDGYISRAYYPGDILQSVTYYDKNLNSLRGETYNIQTGNLSSEQEYNENGDYTKQVSYNADGSIRSKTEYEYDEFGNVVVHRGYSRGGAIDGDLEEIVYTYSYDYDENNRVLRKYYSPDSFATYEYDDATHTVREMNGDYVLQEWVYDENGILRSHYLRQLSYENFNVYDEDGYLLEQTNKKNGELQYTTKYTYATLEELKAMEQEDETPTQHILPTDRVWIDELRSKLEANDREEIHKFLVSEDIESKVEPYFVASSVSRNGDRKSDCYVLVCTDGTYIGLLLENFKSGNYARQILYSTNEEHNYGFDYIGLGDKSYYIGHKTDGTPWYQFFDGRYVMSSDSDEVSDLKEDQYDASGIDQYSSGFEVISLKAILDVIENWVY